MNPHYPFVAARAAHRCEYCQAPEGVFNFPFEVEHIIPASRGGGSDESNRALACRACNLRKADCLTGWDEETRSDVTLFHPRRDEWARHFQLDFETGEIRGLSAVGRATVGRLRMNTPEAVTARLLRLRLGLFR